MSEKDKFSGERSSMDFLGPPLGSLQASVWENLRAMKKQNRLLRYKAVEEVMSPLINQVTSLTEFKLSEPPGSDGQNEALRRLGTSARWLGRPEKLVQLVDKAVVNFLAVAQEIAEENPEFQMDVTVACEDVRSKGEMVNTAAVEFVKDTMSPEWRAKMVSAARDLLMSVTRLLVVVDMIDVDKILTISSRVEEKLNLMCAAQSEREVAKLAQDCMSDIELVSQVATVYPNSGDSKASLSLLTSVQADLKKATRMLASASKVFLQCPSEKAAEENREEVLDNMLQSLRTLALLTSGELPDTTEVVEDEEGDNLAVIFKNMETCLKEIIENKPSKSGALALQRNLETVLRKAAELADSVSTREYRQRSLLTKSSSLKTELQGLLIALRDEELERRELREEPVRKRTKKMASTSRRNLKALQKELHGVCVDLVSDAFVSLWDPVKDLVNTAQKGRRGQVERCAEVLEDQSNTILKAASHSCLLSTDTKNIRDVKTTSNHIFGLTTQVIRSAQTLVAQPSSITLQKNMNIFQESWAEKVSQLTKAVDAMTPLIDFLTITEAHVCGDGIALIRSMSASEREGFLKSARLVKERCGRLSRMVWLELRRNPARYTSNHKKKIKHRTEELDRNVVAFKEHVDKMKSELSDASSNCGLLTHAMETVVDGVRSLREEVLSAMTPEDQEKSGVLEMVDSLNPLLSVSLSQISLVSVSEVSEPITSPTKKFQRTPRHSDVFDLEASPQSPMAALSPEQKTQLAKATAGFSTQQLEFESEVQQWDAENDIVVLAKEMCMMVMDMSDFARNLGPLKTMTDMAITSKDIARAGEYICSIASTISSQCPDDKSKRDLLAYTDRMKLFCHQLKITSSVRADSAIQTVDSASSLITTARNSLNAAVELVRMCYLASVQIAKLQKGTAADHFSVWRMTLPKKKDLEKGSTSKDSQETPIHRLGQFKPGKHRQAPFV